MWWKLNQGGSSNAGNAATLGRPLTFVPGVLAFERGLEFDSRNGKVGSRNNMIKGVHTMFYSSLPEELRAFIRHKLGFPFTDAGEGWLIFDPPEAELPCHSADPAEDKLTSTNKISLAAAFWICV